MLKYPPFAASHRMVAAARNHHALVANERGPAVALLQSGLVQVGMSLPGSMKKGVADGIYGRETIEAVKAFQRANYLSLVDGFAGRETIILLDGMLAKASGMSWPIPAGPPSSPSDPDYEIGSGDPPLHHDPGAGVWNSKPTEASYVALKLSIIEILPEAAVIVGLDAARHMAHYLKNTGKDLTINLEGMVKDVPSAQVRYKEEVAEVQRFVETLPPRRDSGRPDGRPGGRAFMMSQVPIAMVSAVFLLGAVDGCRKGQEEDRAVTRTKETSASLADLAREAGVTFPASARLIGFSREAGIDDYLNFKVEIDAKDLAAFLATSPISVDALQPGEHGRLGPDEGYWDPHRAARLRTGQKMMPNARYLNIGIGEGGGNVVALYIVNHGT